MSEEQEFLADHGKNTEEKKYDILKSLKDIQKNLKHWELEEEICKKILDGLRQDYKVRLLEGAVDCLKDSKPEKDSRDNFEFIKLILSRLSHVAYKFPDKVELKEDNLYFYLSVDSLNLSVTILKRQYRFISISYSSSLILQVYDSYSRCLNFQAYKDIRDALGDMLGYARSFKLEEFERRPESLKDEGISGHTGAIAHNLDIFFNASLFLKEHKTLIYIVKLISQGVFSWEYSSWSHRWSASDGKFYLELRKNSFYVYHQDAGYISYRVDSEGRYSFKVSLKDRNTIILYLKGKIRQAWEENSIKYDEEVPKAKDILGEEYEGYSVQFLAEDLEKVQSKKEHKGFFRYLHYLDGLTNPVGEFYKMITKKK